MPVAIAATCGGVVETISQLSLCVPHALAFLHTLLAKDCQTALALILHETKKCTTNIIEATKRFEAPELVLPFG